MRVTKKYVDHPAPSVVLVAILLLVIGGVLASIPNTPSNGTGRTLFWAVIGSVLAIAAFYFWPFYSTYLKRRARGYGLYLTPSDPRAFIQRITEFAPELTAEVIL